MSYLGERKADLSKDPIYKNYSPQDYAMLWIEKYGQIDGSHHKAWVLDQVARILKGGKVTAKIASWSDHPDEYRFSVGTSKEYKKWVKDMISDDEYDYDEGIAP